MTAAGDYESDPRATGLAAERTLLAWGRTGLTFVGVGAGVLRVFAGTAAGIEWSLVGAAALGIGVLVIIWGRLAYADEMRNRPPSARRLRTVAYMNAGMALVALVLAATAVPGR